MVTTMDDQALRNLTTQIRASLVPLSRALRSREGGFAPTELSVIGAISRVNFASRDLRTM